MFAQSFALLADLWGHVGPGILLAAALPIFLIALALVARVGVRRLTESRKGA